MGEVCCSERTVKCFDTSILKGEQMPSLSGHLGSTNHLYNVKLVSAGKDGANVCRGQKSR